MHKHMYHSCSSGLQCTLAPLLLSLSSSWCQHTPCHPLTPLPCFATPATLPEVLCLYEDEVVLLWSNPVCYTLPCHTLACLLLQRCCAYMRTRWCCCRTGCCRGGWPRACLASPTSWQTCRWGGQGWLFWNDPHQAISGGSSGGSGQQGGWYMLAILLPSQHDSCNTSTC
jgi:hypothetical protein